VGKLFRVGLTYNLKRSDSAEEDAEFDSPQTIDAVRSAIEERWPCVPIEADERVAERLRRERPDLVFNMAECAGGPGREGYVPSILEHLGIPYTGSDPTTLNVCLHKVRAKEILACHGIRTPRWIVFPEPKIHELPFDFPAVVKPLHEGSSKGVKSASFVQNERELAAQVRRILRECRQPALVEAFLPGREFTVASLGNGRDLEVLPIVEIRFDTLPKGVPPLYSYEAKWIWDTAERPIEIFDCPARLDRKLKTRIEEVALGAIRTLDVRDWCRIDLRLDAEGEPNLLELNPLPGILPKPEDNSCFPKAARAAGLSYAGMIHRVIEAAARRLGLRLPSPVAAR
jgi:D-alanine-D-alanine ligase